MQISIVLLLGSMAGVLIGSALFFALPMLLPGWSMMLLRGPLRGVARHLTRAPYEHNRFEMIHVLRRSGWQRILETELRAASDGHTIERPIGTPHQPLGFQKIAFAAAVLDRRPLPVDAPIDSSVIVGPLSARPLTLELPVYISGMGYGVALSRPARIALAKGASTAGTASNSGLGPLLPEERQVAARLMVQVGRPPWTQGADRIRGADAIEVQLGTGAWGAYGYEIPSEQVGAAARRAMGLGAEDPVVIPTDFSRWQLPQGLDDLLGTLKEQGNGVPVGVKLPASQHLEEELLHVVRSGADFVTLDAGRAGIVSAPPLMEDAFGLPLIDALLRAQRLWEQYQWRGRVTLVVSGGLLTPEDFLKALALGADVVAIGTAALLALAHPQLPDLLPQMPPTELLYAQGSHAAQLDVDRAAHAVTNFLQAANEEMKVAARSMGKHALQAIDRADLVALDTSWAKRTQLRPAWTASPERGTAS
ncbi:MAG: FMN-binding glutamate synthase family protein [Firmicutes bacterium]|nr:FMN-binding glutamate synthase family protein [Bacillota bacterium]